MLIFTGYRHPIPVSLYDSLIATFLEALVLLIAAVLVLYDDGGIAALLEAFLGVVATELALDQHRCLSHLLVVCVLKTIV